MSPTNDALQDILEECRRTFGPPPRRFGWWDKNIYLDVPRPQWCTSRDLLSHFFTGRKRLLENGYVVWGHTVQANGLLFRPGQQNCPGETIFCPDPNVVVDTSELERVAHTLFALKGKPQPAPDLQYIGDYLANERVRVFGHPVPPVLSPQFPCAISSGFFTRKHLPDNRLKSNLFPLIVSPNVPQIVMVLPSRWWPSGLRYLWGSH